MEGKNFKPDSSHKGPRSTAPVLQLIRWSDMLLEIVDARYPDLSRNQKLELRIRLEGRRYSLVFNKIDLVSDAFLHKLQKRFPDAFFVSARKRMGLSQLRTFLAIQSKKKEITVGLIGYPNTGKSSIINMLAGAHSARTSSRAGFTKGLQKIRMGPNIMLWDTPGVTPFGEDETLLAMLGSRTPEKLKDAEDVALKIIHRIKEEFPSMLTQVYDIEPQGKDEDAILEEIAKKIGTLKRGGLPETERAARSVIHDWQKGKFKLWELKE